MIDEITELCIAISSDHGNQLHGVNLGQNFVGTSISLAFEDFRSEIKCFACQEVTGTLLEAVVEVLASQRCHNAAFKMIG